MKDRKHTVLLVNQQDADRQVAIDLGPKDKLKDLELKKGTKVEVRGPLARVGEQPIVMARKVSVDGKSIQIDRSQRSRGGKVVDTREVTLRGETHRLAIVQSKKNEKQRLAVDLGPAKKLDLKIEKGDEIQVEGFPIKTKDKIILMAQNVSHDGEQFEIARAKSDKGASMATAKKQDEKTKR